VLAAVDWANLVPAAAFVAGAILATIGVLRVVRAVAVMFGGEIRRGRRRGPSDAGSDDDARSK
jgi:hypothetical protein